MLVQGSPTSRGARVTLGKIEPFSRRWAPRLANWRNAIWSPSRHAPEVGAGAHYGRLMGPSSRGGGGGENGGPGASGVYPRGRRRPGARLWPRGPRRSRAAGRPDVLDVLQADRQAHRAGRDGPWPAPPSVSCECVVEAGWMTRDCVADIGNHWQELNAVRESPPASYPPLMTKESRAPVPSGAYFLPSSQ